MFRGFFDESHRNPTDRQFIMAGWTANVKEWDERFSNAWQDCLSEPPRIKYFKTYEAYNSSGEFLRFSDKQRDAKCLALARVIADHKVRGYVATASHKITKNKPQRLGKMMGTRIYDWAFMTITSTVLQDQVNRRVLEKVDFIFDKASELRACIESYELVRERLPLEQRQIAGEAIPGEDKELAGLQAADLLAGEVSFQLKFKRVRPPFQVLIDAGIQIVHASAIPPLGIEATWQYAQEVYARRELASTFIKFLKSKGLTFQELKRRVEMLESKHDANAKGKTPQ